MNIYEKLQETTMNMLTESFGGINSMYLSKYIEDNINAPLSTSAKRIYNAINFDIDEKDKKILSLAIVYRFASKKSTIPPFILDALGQERLDGKYPKIGTIKWFLENPEALELYYNKYKGTDKLPYTDTKQQYVEEDKAKQLYKSSKFIKSIYDMGDDSSTTVAELKQYIQDTDLPLVVQYGTFNKNYDFADKNNVLKSLDFYKLSCSIDEMDKCIFIIFYIDGDLGS